MQPTTPAPRSPRPAGALAVSARAARVAWGAFRHFGEDHASTRAAAIAYYGLLAFFPFLALVVSAGALVLRERDRAMGLVDALARIFPFVDGPTWQQGLASAEEQVQALAASSGLLSLVSLGILLVVASRVWSSLEGALHVIFRTPRAQRPFLRELAARLRGVVATLAIMTVLLAWLLLRGLFKGLALAERFLPEWLSRTLADVVPTQLLVPAAVVGLIAYATFRSVPGAQVARRSAAAGALLFVLGHEASVVLFGWAVVGLSRASLLYGSFAGIVLLVVWVYWQSALLLFTAEVVAVLNGSRPSFAPRA